MPLPVEVLPVPPVLQRELEKPEVILPGAGVTISQTAGELFGAIAREVPPTVFWRGGAAVRLCGDRDNKPSITVLTAAMARSLFEQYAHLRKYRVKDGQLELRDAILDEAMAKAILAAQEASRFLPPLAGILRCPRLSVDDGQIRRIGRGYDGPSGLYVWDAPDTPVVAAGEAAAAILDLFAEFHFEGVADRSRAVASLLAPALKHAGLLNGSIPLNIAEADRSQAGKGLFPQIHGALYGEEAKVVARRKGGVGSFDESLASHFLTGGSLIHLDNVRGALKSEYLEAALTSRTHFPVRVPHLGQVDVDISNTVIWLSSNGFESTMDLGNRASIVRIRKREGFQYSNIPQQVRDRRGYFLGCLFSIIEEYFRQGSQRTCEGRHSFHDWAQTLDWIVQNLFELPPLLDGHAEAQAVITNPALGFLRQLAIAVDLDERLGMPLTATDLVDVCVLHDVRISESKANSDLEDLSAARTIGKRLQPLFRGNHPVRAGRFEVMRSAVTNQGPVGNQFSQRLYTFSQLPSAG